MQGTTPSEELAALDARDAARGGTAYLNLEPGDCHGDSAAIRALLGTGVSRVVLGLSHPLPHLRGVAASKLRGEGVTVDILSSPATRMAAPDARKDEVYAACLSVNEPLLHRAVLRRPMSILKYAMTLDGKIAAKSGHSAWVSSKDSRKIVFNTRARSNAIIVGGCTLRRDNPRLTTRMPRGHRPVRIVMSRTFDLPEGAKLWDVSVAPTIAMT